MRVAASEEEFEFQFNVAQRESANAFGDDTMYIERFVENPRHVEIQIMADNLEMWWLLEKETVLYRETTNLVESPFFRPLQRRQRKNEPVCGSGSQNSQLYKRRNHRVHCKSKRGILLYGNERQDYGEHGVTEMVTGTDLIVNNTVAMGLPLSFSQEDVKLKGHAIESRLNTKSRRKTLCQSGSG